MKPSSTDTQDIERAIDAGNGEGANHEQEADRAATRAWVAEEDQAQATATAPQQAQAAPAIPEPSAASLKLAGMLVGTLRPLLCFVVKPLRAAPAELWEPIPHGVAGVLDHYDLSQSEMLRNPWARLAFSTLPLVGYVVATAEASEPAKPSEPERIGGPELAAQAPAERPGSRTVSFGAVEAAA